MAVNKVVYNAQVLLDLTSDTVTADKMLKGTTAHDKSGALITGTHECAETEPTLQNKTVTPTTNIQNVTADSGYDGLASVTVNAMPTATQATPSITVSSAGKITASATQSAGYVAAGTKSATKQLTTQAAKTITPTESSQTAVASGRYTTGAVTVGAIPSGYLVSSEIATQDSLISQIQTALQGKAAGGGGNSGGSYATGAIWQNVRCAVPSGKTICTVTGLPFKPTHVIIMFTGDSNFTESATSYYVPVFIENGLQSNSVYARKYNSTYMYLYPKLSYTTLTLTNDGFTWVSKNSNVYVPYSLGYSYVAFGGDFVSAGTYNATNMYSSSTSGGSAN